MVGIVHQQPHTAQTHSKVAAVRPVTPPMFPFSVGGMNAIMIELDFPPP
jgi:hypothetical protein